MTNLISPGNLITVAGGVLTVVGAIAYGSGNANLSLPTIFYGIPILLGGLALKSSELPPARRVIPATTFRQQREAAAPELGKLLGDVTRWRYGQKAHLESSLEALKLWDEDTPPQLLEIEELASDGGYGLRLRFTLGAVPLERWQEREERLGRFFAKGLQAKIAALGSDRIDLTLLPAAGEHGEQ
ncbi:DUF2854 domain-containing protein [Synechococcus sp. HK01-R]|uniref:DUF2854 domain-containing protein n=1 Tax=Synechococcus sp. HK01-R TaxID=2751171 RepID=UPI0016269535|nr:DUF2854 domain-containing protein [Synechococcus sp. HK01-R]QNG26223.1 DUF2854 domain-containing protein [Synechococcus sp. HK01-R]